MMTTCLIVDDEEQSRYLLEVLLRGHGYETDTARNGAEALDKARQNPPSLIISDIMMPVMDGFQFCRECKIDPALKAVPFIFYTAHYTEEKDRELALAVGAQRFIVKPQDPVEFLELVKEVLNLRWQARETVKTPLDREEYLTAHDERVLNTLEKKMTEMAELNRELQKSGENFRHFLNDSPLGARIVTEAGETIYANKALLDIYGYETLEELQKTGAKDRYSPETYAAFLSRREKRRHGEAVPTGYEVNIIRKDGQSRCLQVFRKEIIWNGEPQFQVLYHDITERKKAEEKVRKSEANLKTAQEQLHIGSWEYNLSTREHFWSDEMFRIIECHSESGTPDYQSLIQKIHPDDRERIDKSFREALQEKKSLHEEYRIVLPDGLEKFLEARGNPIFDHTGKMTHYVGTAQDITLRKRSEQERNELQEQLLQSRKLEAVGVLAGGVAHDFNNILGAIMGYAEITLDKMSPEDPLRKNLEKILDAAQRSSNITRQLLAFARKQVISPVVFDINDSIEATMKMIRRLIGENIELDWRPGKTLCRVRMDPSQLDQILLNLCVNARDSISSVGKIIISTDTVFFDRNYTLSHAEIPPGKYALLSVSDNGCGMDRETEKHIFEPFFTTKGPGKGTGMGLATVYGIVKQNDGYIHVYSEREIGTAFKIYIPVHAEKSGEAAKEPAEKLPRGRGETVLLVEDEQAILDMTTLMLSNLGYTVLSAETPGKALKLATDDPTGIQLVITDVVMPEMNGKELVRRLLEILPNIKHLFISGYTADVIEHQGVLDDGVNFLQKPFLFKDLAKKIRQVLD